MTDKPWISGLFIVSSFKEPTRKTKYIWSEPPLLELSIRGILRRERSVSWSFRVGLFGLLKFVVEVGISVYGVFFCFTPRLA